MKRPYYSYSIAILVLILAIPTITSANVDASNITVVSPTVKATPTHSPIIKTISIPPMPPIPADAPASVREKLRADYEAKIKNLKDNQNYRNGILENQKIKVASTTKIPANIPLNQTAKEKLLERQREEMEKKITASNGKTMRVEAFKNRQEKIVRELNVALNNLDGIRSRIISRIEKAETSGRNMTEARKSLAEADIKITIAKNAVSVILVIGQNATSTTNTATSTRDRAKCVKQNMSSTTNIENDENDRDDDKCDDKYVERDIDLEKPREIASKAIEAVKEAKKALNKTVVAIAHSMGLKVEGDKIVVATTTTTTTATTTSTTTNN